MASHNQSCGDLRESRHGRRRACRVGPGHPLLRSARRRAGMRPTRGVAGRHRSVWNSGMNSCKRPCNRRRRNSCAAEPGGEVRAGDGARCGRRPAPPLRGGDSLVPEMLSNRHHRGHGEGERSPTVARPIAARSPCLTAASPSWPEPPAARRLARRALPWASSTISRSSRPSDHLPDVFEA